MWSFTLYKPHKHDLPGNTLYSDTTPTHKIPQITSQYIPCTLHVHSGYT